MYHHPDVRRVVANGAEWARPERERELPTLRRYDLGEYFDGQHYRGPFDDAPEDEDATPTETGAATGAAEPAETAEARA